MTPLLADIAREAWARWRRDREALALVAGVFLFVPLFAWFLLIPEPVRPATATDQQAYAIVVAWIGANLYWLMLRIAFELYAAAVLLGFYLWRDHATLGALLKGASVALPGFAAAVLASWGLIALGFGAFIVPGIYLYGRVALAGPVYVAEPNVGAFGALARSFALTHNQGWRVALSLAAPLLAGVLALRLVSGIEALAGEGQVVTAVCAGLGAAAGAATGIAAALFKVALYRRLSAPRHGI